MEESLMRFRAASVDVVAAAAIGVLAAVLACSGCGQPDSLPAEDPSRLTIQLRSPAFVEGGMIPKAHTCDGSDRSPPLEWSGVPSAARTLALVCDDPDAPMGTWSHWVVFNLSPRAKAFKEGVPPEETLPASSLAGTESGDGSLGRARQGRNDFKKTGYGGPCPPSGTHRYFFRLYALDNELALGPTANRADVLKAIAGHILAEGRLVGKYQRGGKQ
jgi:Raf kinase inhibitor-like YbhB/YbcL family protein